MMNKSLFIILLTILASTGLQAKRRSPQQLQAIAHRLQATECLQAETHLAVYATTGNGFVVLSTDDRWPELLATSDTPFDQATHNPGFRWWLSAMEQSLAQTTTTAITRPDPDRFEPEQPALIQTRWAQTSPYYNMCPMPDYSPWGGYIPDVEHCAVGCVALAAAQLVNYYQYPDHGEGSHSITVGNQTYTVDFSEATYDWSLMLDTYADGYTDEQAQAVAQLCYHLGVASEMGYSVDASATDNYYAILALGKYFGYDISEVQQINRDNYDEPQWMNLVYTELSARRPIFYEGIGIDPHTYEIYGHSFLIDGYNSDGLVHVNWGWGGKADGYFDISHLDPSTVNFDDAQMMAIGLQAPNFDTGISSPSTQLGPMGRLPKQEHPSPATLDGRPLDQPLPHQPFIHNGKKYILP